LSLQEIPWCAFPSTEGDIASVTRVKVILRLFDGIVRKPGFLQKLRHTKEIPVRLSGKALVNGPDHNPGKARLLGIPKFSGKALLIVIAYPLVGIPRDPLNRCFLVINGAEVIV
jgi:hypothetical protein